MNFWDIYLAKQYYIENSGLERRISKIGIAAVAIRLVTYLLIITVNINVIYMSC